MDVEIKVQLPYNEFLITLSSEWMQCPYARGEQRSDGVGETVIEEGRGSGPAEYGKCWLIIVQVATKMHVITQWVSYSTICLGCVGVYYPKDYVSESFSVYVDFLIIVVSKGNYNYLIWWYSTGERRSIQLR